MLFFFLLRSSSGSSPLAKFSKILSVKVMVLLCQHLRNNHMQKFFMLYVKLDY